MGDRGRGGRGGFRGGRGGDRGGFRGGRGGFGGRFEPEGPPETVEVMGSFMHPCEDEMVFKSSHKKIPKFNSFVYFENKQEIGKIDEIFGPVGEVYFTVKPKQGIQASSFKDGDKCYIGPNQLLPVEMFTEENKPKPAGARGGRGGPRGGRGGPRGGRGGSPRGGRGGFSPRGGRGGFSPRGGSPRGGRGSPRGGRGRGF